MVRPKLAVLTLGMPPALALTWYLTVLGGLFVLPAYLVASGAILIATLGSVIAFFRERLRPAPVEDTARLDARLRGLEGNLFRIHGALAIRGIIPQPGQPPRADEMPRAS